MGVQGLLGLLKSIHKHNTLKAYAGQTLGVDAFGWLHRGAVACAADLALDKPNRQYISFVINRVRMLLDFGVIPYLVFDGDSLPSKAATNAKRRKDRDAAKEAGLALWRAGKKDLAYREFQKCVSVTPQMTFAVIEELRRMNVKYLVAPYEADAQLAYLEREGIVDGILSEDSDLLVFGARKLITKLDQYGACIELNRSDFNLVKELSFAGWSDTMFRRMAILSGCDYIPSVTGVGLRTAHQLVKKHKETARIVRVMALNGKFLIPKDYLDRFEDAEHAFLYHRVFCPKAGKLVHLNILPPHLNVDEMTYLGSDVDPEIAIGVACGDLNPKTKETLVTMRRTPGLLPKQYFNDERRATIADSGELKPKRSIDSFFKPPRMPLAELDPNSLTPSPSQQRVLERNRNASWEPRHAQSAPPLRRTVTDVPQPQATPDSSHSSSKSFLARASTLSAYKPVKRQRLCSKMDEDSGSQEIKQSRFFASGDVAQSPLRSKKLRDKKSKRATFDVFSDDSIEEAMLQLDKADSMVNKDEIEYPKLPPSPLPELQADRGDVPLEVVPQSPPLQLPAAQGDSQSSHGTVELQSFTFESNVDDLDPNAPVSKVENPMRFEELLQQHLQEHNEETQARRKSRTFSVQSPETQSAALATLVSATPAMQPSASLPEHLTPAGESPAEPELEDLLSPQRVSSMKFRSLAKTFSCQSPEQQTNALRSLKKVRFSFNDDLPGALGAGGSEDAIPPSSPDYNSEPDLLPEAERKPSTFSYLKRFAFTG